jgi:hypothetical protein
MSFDYTRGQPATVYTPPGKGLQCRSFKINIAAGDGFTTATEYFLCKFPAGTQFVGGLLACTTAVSGGTVSAATLAVRVNSTMSLFLGNNVYAAGTGVPSGTSYFAAMETLTGDLNLTYIPTLTGSGATAGII